MADNETLTTEKEYSATIKIHPGVPDIDSDMLMKTDIMHDILKDVMSNVTHIDVVPMEEKNKLESKAINDMYELFGGGLEAKEMKELCMEYDGENSSLEAMIINNFNNDEMIPPALEYKKQQ